MSLVFGGAASDRVDCGSGANLDDLDPFTWLLWIYPTTLTASRGILTKPGHRIAVEGTAGEVRGVLQRATTAADFRTNSAPLALNTWCFLAMTADSTAGAGELLNIYSGRLNTPAAECTYGTASNGSGAVSSDAAGSVLIGNTGGLTVPFQGRIATVAIFPAKLTLAQIQSWQLNPRSVVDGLAAAGMWNLGLDPQGAGNQLDLSGNGNTGIVTGATVGDHVPLAPLYDHLERATRRRVQLRR